NFLILAAIFILFFIVMDFSDGEVSRYRGQTSKEGSYLDKIYIFVGHPIIIAGVAIYQIQMDNSLSTIVLGFSCTVFVFAFSMVVDYTKKIVIWAHFEKLISSQDYSDSGCGLKVQEKMVRPSAEDSPEKFVKLEWIYRKLHSGIAIFDFPYIFLLLSLVILMEAILPIAYFGGLTPIHIFIYTFGIAYPLVTVAFLIKNIFQKRISQQYTELVGRIER
ncbi:MAG: CDP-alcohol phosphatidyltransferase family protein, partial [Nitrospinaceae bacterium]|nr:CDP-alcohol phosphatidyltransferase family protein [Nitrospinaceae bacterium]